MPRGPRGERRPAGTVECAHKVFRIAIGEEKDVVPSGRRKSGRAGSRARTSALSKKRRREIARRAAAARWRQEVSHD